MAEMEFPTSIGVAHVNGGNPSISVTLGWERGYLSSEGVISNIFNYLAGPLGSSRAAASNPADQRSRARRRTRPIRAALSAAGAIGTAVGGNSISASVKGKCVRMRTY